MVGGLEGPLMVFEVTTGDVAAFLRVMLGMVIAFGVLPMFVLPRPGGSRNLLDVYVANLVRLFAIVIALSHLLAALRVYSRVSMIVVLLAIAWWGRYRRQLGGMAGVLQRIYATGDVPLGRPKPARSALSHRLGMLALASPVILLMVATYLLRAQDAFATMNLTPPDSYIHMAWANSFPANDLWPDGIYPQGLSALLAFVRLFTPFTNLLDVARFSGPMVGTFVVFAIYYAVVRLTRNPGAALFAAGLFGLFGAMSEWRVPWHRHVGLLPQEMSMAVGFIAVVFAVLAVTERGGGRVLQLGRAGALSMGGNVLSLFAAGFVAGMTHPLGAAWLGLLVGVAAIAACLVTWRFSFLVGAGIATLGGVGAGLGVVPVAELFGIDAYRGRGAVRHVSRFTPDYGPGELEARVQSRFGGYEWLQHNWLSSLALLFLVVAVVGVVVLVARRATRTQGAQLLGLTAAAALCALAYDLTRFLEHASAWYLVRIANMLGPSLTLAFGAGLGALSVIVSRRITYSRVAVLVLVGFVALGAFAVRVPSPAAAIDLNYEREAIEFEEMTRLTVQIKNEFERGTYSIVGVTTQRQVLAGEGWFIEAWVFARDIDDAPIDDILAVPTPDTFIFVELSTPDIIPIDPDAASEEYYSNPDKRGRIQAILYDWAERRLAENSDTTLYHAGTDIRVYRVARNPAVLVSDDDALFTDYSWRPGELFNEGPTSVAEVREARE